jgi:hypothetical protein
VEERERKEGKRERETERKRERERGRESERERDRDRERECVKERERVKEREEEIEGYIYDYLIQIRVYCQITLVARRYLGAVPTSRTQLFLGLIVFGSPRQIQTGDRRFRSRRPLSFWGTASFCFVQVSSLINAVAGF